MSYSDGTYGRSGMSVIQEWGNSTSDAINAAGFAMKNSFMNDYQGVNEKGGPSGPVRNRLLGEKEEGFDGPPAYEADPTGSRSSRVHDVMFGRPNPGGDMRQGEKKGWLGRKGEKMMSRMKTRLSFG
jgi:hypothetical protein